MENVHSVVTLYLASALCWEREVPGILAVAVVSCYLPNPPKREHAIGEVRFASG